MAGMLDQIGTGQLTPQMLQMLTMMRNGMTATPMQTPAQNMGMGMGAQGPGIAPPPQMPAPNMVNAGGMNAPPANPNMNPSALSSPLGGMLGSGGGGQNLGSLLQLLQMIKGQQGGAPGQPGM